MSFFLKRFNDFLSKFLKFFNPNFKLLSPVKRLILTLVLPSSFKILEISSICLLDLTSNNTSWIGLLNNSFKEASKKNLKNILEATEEKLVSIDFNHNSNSAIVDLSLTNVVGKKMGKVSAWYDNEWGFASRMSDLAEFIHKI